MKILIIGGTGTMGRPLVTALYEKGYDLTVICRKKVQDDRSNIKYCYGNAKDHAFISSVLSKGFDVIVDFCWYSSKEFASNYKTLLGKTQQYICLSSAAVYSDVPAPKNESSPRYLDLENPEEGTASFNWYCYEKARIEDILLGSDYRNWTIVRPGTTMNSNHFGFGHEWMLDWIGRVIQGKKVIVVRDMLDYKFSLSSGLQVVNMILSLIGNKKAIGETFNVCSTEIFTWKELLDLYIKIFKKEGLTLKMKMVSSQEIIARNTNPLVEYWYKRARLLDRVFDSQKVYSLMNNNYTPPMAQQLEMWVHNYMNNCDTKIPDKLLWHTAYKDRITGDLSSISHFHSNASYAKYLLARFLPKLYNYFFYRKTK